MNEAWEIRGVDPTTKLILMCLADHANEDDRTCWPAIATIARKCDVSRATVKRRMQQLEQYGLIKRRSRTGDSTLYFILPEGEVQSEPGSTVSRGRVTTEPGGGSTAEPQTTMNRKEPSLLPDVRDCLEDEFEQWWCDEYPDRDGSHSKAKAKQAYIRYRKKGVSKEQIWQATLTYFHELEAHDRVSTRFVKHATTFLNEEPWVR